MKSFYKLIFSVLLYSNFVIAQGNPGDVGTLTGIDSYTSFQGYDEDAPHLGQGEYQIFYDNVDGVLDKPIIICDGFDPEDTRDISTIYGIGDFGNPTQNIFDNLRDLGADIVVLNFPNYTRSDDGAEIQGGADYIERNGLVLVNLIETINTDKTGNNELIVVGPSMGGLITRYALTYMEQNAMDHQTGIWLSFDSPHRGANVPISFQYAVNYLAEYTGDADMAALRDVQLNSAAAKQMLLDHYTSHLQDGEAYDQDTSLQLPLPNAYRNTFMNTMDAMGFPTQTRNLAIINGSITGATVASPGTLLMDGEIDPDGIGAADVNLHFTPASGVSDFNIDHIVITAASYPIDTFDAVAASPSESSGLDSCPGGIILFDSFFGDDPSDVEQQVQDALLVDAFSFIPTMSSMAIDQSDWYHVVNGSESTPFDNYIGGSENQPHLTLTEDYANFMMDEFSALYLGISSELLADSFQLLQNPVQQAIRVRVNSNHLFNKVSFQLFTVSGQMIGSYRTEHPEGLISLPAPSTSGLYLLRISSGDSFVVKKVLVQ